MKGLRSIAKASVFILAVAALFTAAPAHAVFFTGAVTCVPSGETRGETAWAGTIDWAGKGWALSFMSDDSAAEQPLIAGKNGIQVGTVVVDGIDCVAGTIDLTITITEADWVATQIHAYAGDDPPRTKANFSQASLKPGQFPVNIGLPGGSTGESITVPIEGGCPAMVYVHVDVETPINGGGSGVPGPAAGVMVCLADAQFVNCVATDADGMFSYASAPGQAGWFTDTMIMVDCPDATMTRAFARIKVGGDVTYEWREIPVPADGILANELTLPDGTFTVQTFRVEFEISCSCVPE